jgi:shikimate dehydrogenase
MPPQNDTTENSGFGKPDSMPSERKTAGAAIELGGPAGLEPTRYGDWEKNGRCIDF